MLPDRNWIRQLMLREREQHEPLVLLVLVDEINVRLLRHVEIEEQPVTWRNGAAVPKSHSFGAAKRVERRFDFVACGSDGRVAPRFNRNGYRPGRGRISSRGRPADSRGPQTDEKDGDGESPGRLPPFEPRSGEFFLRL